MQLFNFFLLSTAFTLCSTAALHGFDSSSFTHSFPLRKVRYNRRLPTANQGDPVYDIYKAHTGLENITNQIGAYSIDISVGTPGQIVSLEIDTGSSDVWVISSNSSFCADPDNGCDYGLFDTNNSSSLSYLDKTFNITYRDGSNALGEWVSESISFAGFTLDNYTLGVDYFGDESLGFMGLGFSALESTNFLSVPEYTYPNILPALKQAGLINRAAFSLYLDGIENVNGTILFGGIDNAKLGGDLFTLPLIPSGLHPGAQGYLDYSIQINSVSLGNTALTSQAQVCLLDSGYGLAAFSPSAFNVALEFFNATANPLYGGQYTLSCDFENPDEIFSFTFPGGNSLKVPASNFLIPLDDGANTCAFGIMNSGDENLIVFGDPILRAAYVVYDQEAYQVSIAQARLNVTDTEIVAIPPLSAFATPTATLVPLPTAIGCKKR